MCGAVACFAYGLPVSMVDTNVRRVLGRVFDVAPEQVEAMADDVVPAHAAYAWNQALMDLGATLCRVRQPLCLVCPLMTMCGGPTPTRRTRPQGEFRGSTRYVRGKVIDALRGSPTLSLADLAEATDATPAIVERLARDGLVTLDGDRVSLSA